ncbi:TNF receptor-associated factor 6 isoform X1 [Neodiprion virginianus]|uniref:TNF receptor-associated factor 6 isoform X1 n=1 Tax=Neodiprion virginianus TaxID=2961670 RepID=UPI001EE6EE8F|nr:TNF receptor-associated factor 6 isoform X1 [Neodiprion virginianus]
MASFNDLNKHCKDAERNVANTENNKADLESRFECPICLTWLRDPVLTSCGHKFCAQCINMWLRKKGTCCPVDSQPLQPESDLFPDLFTRREISQQRAHCPYQKFGCAIELSPIDIDSHMNKCDFRRQVGEHVSCPFKSIGCSDIIISEEELKTHLEHSTSSHLTEILQLVAKVIPKLTSLEQTGSSTRAMEYKWWDPPPKKNLLSTQDEPCPDWQELVKTLYERIVVLEQQNRELTISLSNQQNHLSSIRTSVRYNDEEMILRYCNGLYIWKLDSFREKLEIMITDSLKMFYSPGFYTSPNGYKICARINVSSKDPRYLSLLIHMMHSENDDALDWPFNGSISFVLVHPMDSERNIRDTTFSKPELEAFKKPTCELNKRSFGYTEFVLIKDLVEFLREDSMIMRVEVKPI